MSLPEAHDFAVETRPGPPGRLTYTVTGVVTCPQRGWTVSLQPGREGIWDDPKRAVLELAAKAPNAGPEVVTPVSVDRTPNDDARS